MVAQQIVKVVVTGARVQFLRLFDDIAPINRRTVVVGFHLGVVHFRRCASSPVLHESPFPGVPKILHQNRILIIEFRAIKVDLIVAVSW